MEASMNNLLVVEYLHNHSVAELFAEHGVRVSVSAANPYKASLNYDQIAARNDDQLACQCRGLVLATADRSPFPTEGVCGNIMVLARPMDRFFNIGHGPGGSADVHDADLAHPDARVYEKLDGTLCIVYFDPHLLMSGPMLVNTYGGWCVATRSMPDADRVIDGFGDHTFRSLFEHAIKSHVCRSMFGGLIEGDGLSFDEFASSLDRHCTYCFELTSPRAGSGVVSYDDDRAWLLAVRHTETGREFCPSVALTTRGLLHVAPSHPRGSLSAMRALVESRSPRDAEGVVVRLWQKSCGAYHRVKVKSLAYVAAHGLSGDAASSPRNLLRIILAGQWDDVRVTCKPYLIEQGDRLAAGLARWLGCIDDFYFCVLTELEGRGLGQNRKAFALAVQAAKLPIAPLMSRWTGQVNDARAWVDAARRADGEWGDVFLDSLAVWVGQAK